MVGSEKRVRAEALAVIDSQAVDRCAKPAPKAEADVVDVNPPLKGFFDSGNDQGSESIGGEVKVQADDHHEEYGEQKDDGC